MTTRFSPACCVGLILLACVITACQPAGGSDAGTNWNASGLPMPPAIPATDLPDPGSRGAALVAVYCSQCHGIPSPKSHSADDWRPAFRRMLQYMERSAMMMPGSGMMHAMPMGMRGGRQPTSEEADVTLSYLQTHALVALSAADVPDASSSAARVFTATCARCHALPAPGQHRAPEWPAVVARMRRHMRDLQVSDITDADAASISTYLQRVSPAQP